MVEYLYNAIRATAGQEIIVTARVAEEEQTITELCHLMLFDDKELLSTVDGEYFAEADIWEFTIAPEVTKGLKGRYWYCICYKDKNLCFKQPIYLI